MKVLLLAAGRGERLRPLTDKLPKCMLEVEGKPILQHWIERLRSERLHDIAVNLHHLPEKVREYFGNGDQWGVNLTYAYERELLGTAGTLKSLEKMFSDGPFLVIYADNLSNCGLRAIVDFHLKRKALATMAVCWIEDPLSCGIVEMDADGRILRYKEKPTREQIFSHYINAGIYVFEPEILSCISPSQPCDFSLHILPRLIEERKPLFAYAYSGYILKFDRPQDWDRSLEFLRSQRKIKELAL